MHRYGKLVLAVWLLPQLVSAADLWLVWELDLGDHAPPTSFLVTVTSTSPVALPPPLTVPYAACAMPKAAPPGGPSCACAAMGPPLAGTGFCAHLGCPPPGTYTVEVRAQYAEGVSRGTTATCVTGSALPPPPQPVVQPLPRPAPALVTPPAEGGGLVAPPKEDATLAQPPADETGLPPEGPLPPFPHAPAIPPPWPRRQPRGAAAAN